MDFLKGLAGAFFLFFFTVTAWGGELAGNDALFLKLQEKGILTEDEVKAIRQDDRPLLNIGGRFEYAYRESDASGPVDPTAGFQFRSVRLEFKQRISPFAFVEIDPEFTNSSATHLESAYVALVFGEGEIKLGQHHVPANLETMSSDKYFAFTERNLTSSLAPARQLGASWQQYLLDRTIWYQAGVFNGYLQYGSLAGNKFNGSVNSPYKIYGINSGVAGYPNDNTALLYAGRFEWHPLGNIGSGIDAKQENFSGATGLALGAAWYTSDDAPLKGAVKNTINGSNSYDFDLRFRSGGLDTKASYTQRNLKYNDASNVSQTAPQAGYTVQGSYLITPKFSVALRYDYLTVDGNSLITGPDGEATDQWETVGVNYYVRGHNLKLQADYIFKSERTAANATLSPNALVAQVVYSF